MIIAHQEVPLKILILALYLYLGEECFSAAVMGEVLSGEKQQCLQDEAAAVDTSRDVLRHDNILLEEKVRLITGATLNDVT